MKSKFLIQSLTELGIDRLSGYGDILKGVCPFHSGSAGKTFWIHVDTGSWGCWSTRCVKHSGGNLSSLFFALGVPVAKANELTEKFNSITGTGSGEYRLDVGTSNSNDNLPTTLRDLDESGLLQEAHIIGWNTNWLNTEMSALVGAKKYITSRGITPLTMQDAEVGYDIAQKCLVFTLRGDRGQLLGIARRKPEPGQRYFFSGSPFPTNHPKYKYQRVHKGECLWGLHTQKAKIQAGAPVYVVEGFFDALRLRSLGLIAVAKMGAKLTDRQADLLVNLECPIVLWPDNDSAGLLGVAEDVSKLLAVANLSCVIPEAGDPADATQSQIFKAQTESVHCMTFWSRLPELLSLVS